MTQPSQSNMEQLTIDGGAVPHPPPRPKVTCPDCGKTVVLTDRGELHAHKVDRWGGPCPLSGRRYER